MVGGLGYLVETCSICLIFHHELFQRIQRELDVNWYSFPVTAVTNYHRHNGLKQCKTEILLHGQIYEYFCVISQSEAGMYISKGEFFFFLENFSSAGTSLAVVKTFRHPP